MGQARLWMGMKMTEMRMESGPTKRLAAFLEGQQSSGT